MYLIAVLAILALSSASTRFLNSNAKPLSTVTTVKKRIDNVDGNANNFSFSIFLIRGGSASKVIHVESAASFQESIDTQDKLVVVDFSASWCMPCKMIAPVFEEMACEFSASCSFLKVDVDEVPEIAAKYQVMAMPTFLFIKNGEVVGRFSGASVEKLRETILGLL